MEAILTLANNPIEVFEETTRLLIKIASNILKEPTNLKIRNLQKSNKTVSKKILQVAGGTECLKAMGFQDNSNNFSLPTGTTLGNLKFIHNELLKLMNGSNSSNVEAGGAIPKQQVIEKSVSSDNKPKEIVMEESFKRILPPSYTSLYTIPFFKDIEERFNNALIYESQHLQERALSMIPCKELEMKALNKLRKVQENIKKRKLKDPEVNLQDFLILELLDWFKNDFFEWIDSPNCDKCHGQTHFAHMCKDQSLLIYTNRVEMHICDACKILTPFPRYNDLNILMETRKGRCGEWANTFTLFCRAMGWDTRHVVDATDHVWTEVYSDSQKRWLHCDPCENKCDAPLTYEAGWGKKLSYVIAYSSEEVQDVTWRYTNDNVSVLARRNMCSEDELVKVLMQLRENRQKNLSKSRRDFLTKRLLHELVEFLSKKEVGENEKQGRITGSLDWRISRGEMGDNTSNRSYIWSFKKSDIDLGPIVVKYSSVHDKYIKVLGNGTQETLCGWEKGTFQYANIFRNEETDWKMCYLCRKEYITEGNVTWTFQVDDPKCCKFSEIEYKIDGKTFENGSIDLKVCADDKCFKLNTSTANNCASERTLNIAESATITLTATLSGGKGDASWQHAQLFREHMEEPGEYTFSIRFSFTKLV